MDVMLDLETLSLEHDAAILAIGAVAFDAHRLDGDYQTFFVAINASWIINGCHRFLPSHLIHLMNHIA